MNSLDKQIKIIAFTKDGNNETLYITSDMLGDLLIAIQEKGSEYVRLKDRTIIVVGIIFIGKEMKEQIIVCGQKNTDKI